VNPSIPQSPRAGTAVVIGATDRLHDVGFDLPLLIWA
jgi:hypothetical protein